ncbi:hypothetical protein SEA_SHAM_138 [Streptomyces phage Sham]|nr:hypothetical protein SEA_SHAM_138 [Streptomyces phage Sham]
MSYIVFRDVFGLSDDDPLVEWIDKIDDLVIQKYQEGYVKDEFGSHFTLESAEEYCKERGYCTAWPMPNSFDALLILHNMIKNGEIEFEFPQ